jgi:hypothetical protein
MTVLFLVGLWGCGGPEVEATVVEGFGYEWDLFNHRVSHLGLIVAADSADIAVVGGTSTTGVVPELPGGCDPETCQEFPFTDDAIVHLAWARVVTRRAVFGTAPGTLVASAAGGSTDVTVPLPSKGSGDVVAILNGFTIDTDQPLSGGESCYDPAFGWHPRRVAIALGEAVLADDGLSVTVGIDAFFEAGNSLESERVCVDAVANQAAVAMTVQVLVAVGGDSESYEVAHAMTYAYGDGPNDPAPQDPPDLTQRGIDVGLEGALTGWSALDWRFHVDDPDDRGAYPRSLSFEADPVEGWASGHATNYSPITQLSGFDYAFAGTAVSLSVGEVTRGAVDATIPVALDAEGIPVATSVSLTGS